MSIIEVGQRPSGVTCTHDPRKDTTIYSFNGVVLFEITALQLVTAEAIVVDWADMSKLLPPVEDS